MAFDQSAITSLSIVRDMGEILVSWTSTAPAGTLYQVYLDGVLAWEGMDTAVHLPAVPVAARIDVGSVTAAESGQDFASSLPAVATRKRPKLTWYGGTFEAADITGFRVYGETTAGGGVDYASPLGTVPADPEDGWGIGEWGRGGWGRAASTYQWTGRPLSGGVWTFAVRPIDAAGNEGTGSTVAVTIAAPPDPPAPFADGKRLHSTYNAGTGKVTLTWNASP